MGAPVYSAALLTSSGGILLSKIDYEEIDLHETKCGFSIYTGRRK